MVKLNWFVIHWNKDEWGVQNFCIAKKPLQLGWNVGQKILENSPIMVYTKINRKCAKNVMICLG